MNIDEMTIICANALRERFGEDFSFKRGEMRHGLKFLTCDFKDERIIITFDVA